MTTFQHENNAPPAVQSYNFLSAATERAALERKFTKMCFILTVEQQPKQSRMCGVGEKNNRRPIDPPPAISLTISQSGETGSYVGFPQLESLFLFLQVTLVHRETLQPVVVPNRERQMTALVGVTNTTLHRVSIPGDQRHPASSKGIFAFTDLSVRQEGYYCLRFNLFELLDGETLHRAEIFSDVFRVYPAKTFPGMAQSTEFTDILKKHGIRVRVSKSIRTSKKLGNKQRLLKAAAAAGNGQQPYPYNSTRSHRADRFRRGSDGAYSFQPPTPGTTTLLPPPNHSQTSPSPTTPNYERGFEHNYNNWTSRDGATYNDRRDYHAPGYADRHRSEYEPQRNRPPHENYSHHPAAAPMPPPYSPGYPTPPVQYANPYNHTNRVQNQQFSPRPFRTNTNEFNNGGHYGNQNEMPRYNHHTSETTKDVHPPFSAIQESRVASHDERPNGHDRMEEQFQPPPEYPVPESSFYSTNSGSMGYPAYGEGYRG